MSTRSVIPAQLFGPLVGQKPWRVALGYGSFVTFEFGKKIKVDGFVHGVWHLWVYMCEWTLVKNGKLLADSEMPREKLASIVPKLEGRPLRQVRISDDLRRTDFKFDGGLVLRCKAFADAEDDEDQWILFMPGGKTLSNLPGALVLQKADQPPRRMPAKPAVQ